MQSAVLDTAGSLLGVADPAPFEVVNGESAEELVLVCEHAGQEIPAALGDLGLAPGKMDLHIAYDIGAGAVSLRIAERLGVPLLLQPYSRLVVDCNRPVRSHEAILEVSDGVEIPGNMDLTSTERQQRFDEIFEPFHEAVTNVIDRHPRRLVIAVHSFTPELAGDKRPWDIGFVFRKDTMTSQKLAASIGELEPGLMIGMNEPYTVGELTDWFVPHHGERRAIAHSLIEIRNDHLDTDKKLDRWADLLCRTIENVLGDIG
ncbi:MAG: N-formylglutamate amidohydrolase [Rhizobiaceae bacterium]